MCTNLMSNRQLETLILQTLPHMPSPILYPALSLLSFISLFTLWPQLLRLCWPHLLALARRTQRPSLWMFIMVGLGANLIALVINNAYYACLYLCRFKCIEQYRINPDRPWPWESDSRWTSRLANTIALVLFNAVVVNFVFAYSQSLLHTPQYLYRVQDWPSIPTMLLHLTLCFLYNQLVSYWAHRALHLPALYPLHKPHHSYTVSISLTATYAHPLEYILSNLLSSATCLPLLSMLTPLHLVSVFLWVYLRLSETIEVHSGYELPWGVLVWLPGRVRESFHDWHHSRNVGNYGSMMGWMDGWMGTDGEYCRRGKRE